MDASELADKLRHGNFGYAFEAADLIESQARRIEELESKYSPIFWGDDDEPEAQKASASEEKQ